MNTHQHPDTPMNVHRWTPTNISFTPMTFRWHWLPFHGQFIEVSRPCSQFLFLRSIHVINLPPLHCTGSTISQHTSPRIKFTLTNEYRGQDEKRMKITNLVVFSFNLTILIITKDGEILSFDEFEKRSGWFLIKGPRLFSIGEHSIYSNRRVSVLTLCLQLCLYETDKRATRYVSLYI